MAAPSRSTLLAQIQKVLKRHYDPVSVDANRSVLEHVIYGLLLENATYAAADAVLAALRESYFDWNEVRVAAATDLAEQLQRLPQPAVTAASLRGVLQAMFDTAFSFDLEHLRKENLGQAVERLERFKGSRPFMVSYVVQAALGGHAIPLDRGALDVFAILGAIGPGEQQAGSVPGLERAVPKHKGVEFASLLHQLSADFVANPHSPSVHKLLLEINPGAKDRLPKRGKKPDEAAKEPKTAGADRAQSRAARPAQGAKGGSGKPAPAGGARRKPR
jgi:endonuclease III